MILWWIITCLYDVSERLYPITKRLWMHLLGSKWYIVTPTCTNLHLIVQLPVTETWRGKLNLAQARSSRGDLGGQFKHWNQRDLNFLLDLLPIKMTAVTQFCFLLCFLHKTKTAVTRARVNMEEFVSPKDPHTNVTAPCTGLASTVKVRFL